MQRAPKASFGFVLLVVLAACSGGPPSQTSTPPASAGPTQTPGGQPSSAAPTSTSSSSATVITGMPMIVAGKAPAVAEEEDVEVGAALLGCPPGVCVGPALAGGVEV